MFVTPKEVHSLVKLFNIELLLKIEQLVMCLAKMAYVYAQLLLFLVWFNNFDRFQIYGVTHSYSSCLFLCALALSRPGYEAGWVYMTKDEDHFRHPTDIQICH